MPHSCAAVQRSPEDANLALVGTAALSLVHECATGCGVTLETYSYEYGRLCTCFAAVSFSTKIVTCAPLVRLSSLSLRYGKMPWYCNQTRHMCRTLQHTLTARKLKLEESRRVLLCRGVDPYCRLLQAYVFTWLSPAATGEIPLRKIPCCSSLSVLCPCRMLPLTETP